VDVCGTVVDVGIVVVVVIVVVLVFSLEQSMYLDSINQNSGSIPVFISDSISIPLSANMTVSESRPPLDCV
jgi:hypothetical protein